MSSKHLTHRDVAAACDDMIETLQRNYPDSGRQPIAVYPVPRGGVPIAYILIAKRAPIVLVDNPLKADCFVDDLIDSGRTRHSYAERFPDKPFFAAFDKQASGNDQWLVFPWEGTEERSVDDAVVRLLQFMGEDPERGGLLETPSRVAKAWRFWTSGYGKKPEDVLKCFEDGADRVDEMVVVRDIPFYSHCEHHLAPFFGTATVAYVPNGKIVGLSKLSRLVDIYARRLQVQERLTNQVADALADVLGARGAGVIVRARHMCMESRGVCQQGHSTVTSALRGALLDTEPRAEFLSLAKG